MAERKVINKYIPPDFDPKKLTRVQGARNTHKTVRDNCGEYIYRRKKFNARKEVVDDEDYLGLPIFRFYIRCPQCLSAITFKTDPKNTDYIAESGAQRNFEPWRDERFLEEELQAERDAEERANPMKALENRQIESKMEMDILDGLDEIKQKNLLFEEIDADLVLKSKLDEKLKLQRMQEEEEEIYVKSLFEGASDVKILRIKDPIEIEEELLLPKKNTAAVVKPATIDASIIGIKRKVETVVDIPIKKATLLSEIDYDSE